MFCIGTWVNGEPTLPFYLCSILVRIAPSALLDFMEFLCYHESGSHLGIFYEYNR